MGTGGELAGRADPFGAGGCPGTALPRRVRPGASRDIQLWSGLTRLHEVVERLPLRAFHEDAGQALYDLPGVPAC
jgi:hypothetical protein